MKPVTLKDVALEAGVSLATASRAMNGMDIVVEEVRVRVQEAAARLKYVPHGAARALAAGRTRTIGILLPDLYGEFFAEIIRGMDAAARAGGFHLMVCGAHTSLDEALQAVRDMGGRVDGLVIMSPFVESQDIAAVLPLDLPLVTIASDVSKAGQAALVIDNFGGAFAAVKHLFEQGCRRLAHISGPQTNFEARERKRGFEAAMQALMPEAPLWIYEGNFVEESGTRGIQTLLSHKPDGLFIANDTMALGALLALREAGVRVPQDIAVVGFDDIPITRFTTPPLSTLRIGMYDIGQRSVEWLLERLMGEGEAQAQNAIITPQLVARGSSLRSQGD